MNAIKCVSAWALFACAMLLNGLPAVSYAQGDFEDVFIFGDSLSDGGNVWANTGETSEPPYALVPTLPYAIGGHHYSNGKTWAERLARALNDNNGGKPALKNPGKHGNYAFGGGRARSGSGNSSPSSVEQVGMYLSDFGTVSPNALYVLQFGGNDIRDALSDPANAVEIVQDGVTEFLGSIQLLYAYGARNFLVANVPNLAHAPAIRLAGDPAVAAAAFLTSAFNGGLAGGLGYLEGMIPDINIYRLDMAGFTDDVVANPGDFGLTDAITPCLSFISTNGAKCNNANRRLFWDGIHPTTAAHKALANAAIAELYGS
jgi:phospholipase/lecithinase/hemolysin